MVCSRMGGLNGHDEETAHERIGKGIYRDATDSRPVKVGTGDAAVQREKRFAFDTPLRDIRAWQDAIRAELRESPGATRAAPEARSRRTRKPIWRKCGISPATSARVCEVDAWTALYGRLRRVQINAEHVRKARATWVADGYTPKTINNRCQTLRHLYRVLDGSRALTPVDDVKPLVVTDSPKVLVPAATFRTVATNLAGREDAGPVHGDRVYRRQAGRIEASGAGRRGPRAARLAVRTAKGGEPRVFWLNDDMLAAWEAFVAADAWGHFDGSDYAKELYAAGWPKDVRPYQARH